MVNKIFSYTCINVDEAHMGGDTKVNVATIVRWLFWKKTEFKIFAHIHICGTSWTHLGGAPAPSLAVMAAYSKMQEIQTSKWEAKCNRTAIAALYKLERKD